MIERRSQFDCAEQWLRSPLASRYDVLLAAFVNLRLLFSEVSHLLLEHTKGKQPHETPHLQTMLKVLLSQVESWQDHWLSIASDGTAYPISKVFAQDTDSMQLGRQRVRPL